jgi:hypothetical protein
LSLTSFLLNRVAVSLRALSDWDFCWDNLCSARFECIPAKLNQQYFEKQFVDAMFSSKFQAISSEYRSFLDENRSCSIAMKNKNIYHTNLAFCLGAIPGIWSRLSMDYFNKIVPVSFSTNTTYWCLKNLIWDQ